MYRLKQLREQIEGFVELPDAPPDWLGQIPLLQKREIDLREKMAVATADAERLFQELESTDIDQNALSKIGRLQNLEYLKAGFIRAERDLPTVRSEFTQNADTVGQLLVRLGRAEEADPSNLLLPDAQSAVFGRLIDRKPSIAEKAAAAQAELSRATMALTAAQRRLGDHPASAGPPCSPVLLPIINAANQSDHILRRHAAEKKRTQWKGTLEARMAMLAPWSGTPEELGRLSVPTDVVFREIADKTQRAQSGVDQLQGLLDQATQERASAAADLQTVAELPGVIQDQEALDVRNIRDAAWMAHRAALSDATADTFEATMRHDDEVSSQRFSHAQELAAVQQRKRTLTLAQSKERQIREKLDDAKTKQQAARDEFTKLAAAVSPALAESLTPNAFIAWRDQWRQAREALDTVREADIELASALDDTDDLRRRLAAALQNVGVPFDPDGAFEELLMAGTNATATEIGLEALRKDVKTAEDEVETRTHAVGLTGQAEKQWDAEWRAACKACWFGEEAANGPVEVVRDMLTTLTTLAHTLSTGSALVVRIDGMNADKAAFATEVAKFAGEIGIDTEGVSVLDCATAIESKVQQAQRAAETRQRLETELATARTLRGRLETRQQEHLRQTETMMTHMQVNTLIDLSVKLQQAQNKAQLKADMAQTEATALAALQVANMAAAEAMLVGVATEDLEADEASLTTKLETLNARVTELHKASILANERLEAVGGDDAVARIEERRRTVLLEIQDKAQRYFRLSVGIAAAERALRSYRDEHRSSMMHNASQAFATITKGAYRKLTTQPEKNDEVLVAVGADGASKLATDLSKGTRFQLYLALRAAGYHELAAIRPPVPFIADDIMETFDNPRSEETFRVFENMARKGQVIYMTHHEHLRRMAEETVPGVRFYDL